MIIYASTRKTNGSHPELACFISNVTFICLLIASLSSWGTSCDLSVNSEEELRSALVSCEGQDGGVIHLNSDISASQGEFSYIGYGGGNLKIHGNGHSISVPDGSQWRILRFGGMGLLTLENITLANGTALGSGGAIYVPLGSITVINSTLTGNKVVQNPGYQCAGGAIYASGPVRVMDSRIIGNQAGGFLPSTLDVNCGGGAIAGGSVTITDSTLSENSAGNIQDQAGGLGGAVKCWGPCVISDTTIMNNSSNGGDGGGIFAHDDLTITSSIIKDNKAFGGIFGGSGGGILGNGRLLITQSIISGNESSNGGGGIVGQSGPLEIYGSTVRGNISARSDGGGIYSINGLAIEESVISGNKAEVNGGGIYSSGSIYINKSTIYDNSAKIRGGGTYIWFVDKGLSDNYNYQIANSTIAKNRAREGGGIATGGNVPGVNKINMNFTTVSSNHSMVGAANLLSSSAVTLKGSVITDPLGIWRNCSKAVSASSSYSIEGSNLNSCGLNRGPGNKRASITAIALSALGDNGGPTPTMLPSSSSILFTSAAADGLGSGIIEDQRLFKRSGSFTIGSVQLLPDEIKPYLFEGFFRPVSNTRWNNIKPKSIVPVRWRLADSGTGRLLTDPASVTSKTYTRIDCSSGLDYPGALEIQANGAAVVWKKASRFFEFKWKSPLALGECIRLDLRFTDHQTHSAKFFIMKPD